MDRIFEKAQKDKQSITADWQPVRSSLIDGVQVREVKNVLKNNGVLTEIYRKDWGLDDLVAAHVFQALLDPKALSAWHAHLYTTDRLFVSTGVMKVVLYDGRDGSPTYGRVNEFIVGLLRPTMIIVPPKVWHGVYNCGTEKALLLNIVDQAYDYEDPDQWRLPSDSPDIPYSFF